MFTKFYTISNLKTTDCFWLPSLYTTLVLALTTSNATAQHQQSPTSYKLAQVSAPNTKMSELGERSHAAMNEANAARQRARALDERVAKAREAANDAQRRCADSADALTPNYKQLLERAMNSAGRDPAKIQDRLSKVDQNLSGQDTVDRLNFNMAVSDCLKARLAEVNLASTEDQLAAANSASDRADSKANGLKNRATCDATVRGFCDRIIPEATDKRNSNPLYIGVTDTVRGAASTGAQTLFGGEDAIQSQLDDMNEVMTGLDLILNEYAKTKGTSKAAAVAQLVKEGVLPLDLLCGAVGNTTRKSELLGEVNCNEGAAVDAVSLVGLPAKLAKISKGLKSATSAVRNLNAASKASNAAKPAQSILSH